MSYQAVLSYRVGQRPPPEHTDLWRANERLLWPRKRPHPEDSFLNPIYNSYDRIFPAEAKRGLVAYGKQPRLCSSSFFLYLWCLILCDYLFSLAFDLWISKPRGTMKTTNGTSSRVLWPYLQFSQQFYFVCVCLCCCVYVSTHVCICIHAHLHTCMCTCACSHACVCSTVSEFIE